MNQEQPKEMKLQICRLCSLKDFRGVLYGRDLAQVFEEGHVYSVSKIMGEIILKDLGKHAVPEYLQNEEGILTGKISQYAVSGVILLTEQEYEGQLKTQE